MAAGARTLPSSGGFRGLDPFRWAWSLLCNVKFALFLVGLAGAAGLIGVLIPQMPGPMRSNPAARDAWMALRHEDFGILAAPMERLDLFEVFQSAWFNGLWFLIIVAVTVCTVSRIRPTWRGIQRPPRVVNDRYFEMAHHRADFTHEGGADTIEQALRKRRYRVERTREDDDGSTHLFAERFAWSGYGTFLSHLALLMLLVGGLLTKLAGFDLTLILAEGNPGVPVFSTPGPNQIFVQVNDAVEGVDGSGNIVDYRSSLTVRRGDETVTCVTTVNDPCPAFGYRIHQAAFFDDIGWLEIAAPDGRLLYSDVIDFDSQTTLVPRFRVATMDGAVLTDAPLPQLGVDPGSSASREDDLAVGQLAVAIPGGEVVTYQVAWQTGEVFRVAIDGADVTPQALEPGDLLTTDALRISYVGPQPIPAIQVDDMPGAGGSVIVQMPVDTEGNAYLVIDGIDDGGLTFVGRDDPVTTSRGYSYAFGGVVEAAGVQVRRDPGDTFIWVAVGMAVVGLAITFYVPRRRLWVKVTPTRTYIAGIAEKTTRLSRELRLMGADLGSRDALQPEDLAPE